MQIIKCGSKVRTKIGTIDAIITAAVIRFDRVQYELSYFSNGEYKNIWMDIMEFDHGDADVVEIGFK